MSSAIKQRSSFALKMAIALYGCGVLVRAAAGQDVDAGKRRPSEACTALSSLALPDTTITTAEEYPVGVNPAPVPPKTNGAMTGVLSVPICRVAGTIKPTTVSNIRFEVWMPVLGWNGKYNGVGNGGTAGFIAYSSMDRALKLGYATGSTDTGHVAPEADGSWMLGHPELVLDFAQRSQHLTAQAAKVIVKAYYGKPAEHAYFTGCSNGGGQGMQEAQRFPGDYDGIVNGDGARNLTHEWPGELYPAWLARSDQQGLIDKLPALHTAVLAKCDKLDGVQDGLIENPATCDFDPSTMQCTAGTDNASCLTPTEVEWVKKIYRGIQDPVTGKSFWPGPAKGSELDWNRKIHPFLANAAPGSVLLPQSYMRSFVYLDAAWEYTDPAFSFDSASGVKSLVAASNKFGPILDADNPDLRPFEKRGGKIIMYHGWSDPDIAPSSMIQFYQHIVATFGGSTNEAAALNKTQDFARLFMVPGMGHCGGGEGPNSFDALSALDEWVVHDKVPEQIVASRMKDGKAIRTRPLCPYPRVAKYKGSGSTDEAQNFACTAP